MTEKGGKAWRQTIFYPFMHASKYGRGTVLRVPVSSDQYDSKEYCDVPYLDAVAVHNTEKQELTIFAVNRNLTETLDLNAAVYGYETYQFIEHITLNHRDLKAVNSAQEERVQPIVQPHGKRDGNTLEVRLPPASWNVIRLGAAV
jgi:alpha-N-arabinofuranosidase